MSRFENQCDDFRLFNLISVFKKQLAPPPKGGEGTQRHPQGQHQAKGGVDSGTALLSSPSSLLTLPFSLFLSSPPPPSSRADKETSSITQKESVGEQAAARLQRKEGQNSSTMQRSRRKAAPIRWRSRCAKTTCAGSEAHTSFNARGRGRVQGQPKCGCLSVFVARGTSLTHTRWPKTASRQQCLYPFTHSCMTIRLLCFCRVL